MNDVISNPGATELSVDELLVDLRRAFRAGGIAARIEDPDVWDGPARGWSDPVLDVEAGVFSVAFCPEVVHEVIGRVEGVRLHDILVTIKASVFLAVSHSDRDDPLASVEERLWHEAPSTLRLLSTIELAALDGA